MIRIRKAIGIDKVGSCGSQTGRLLVHHGYEALNGTSHMDGNGIGRIVA